MFNLVFLMWETKLDIKRYYPETKDHLLQEHRVLILAHSIPNPKEMVTRVYREQRLWRDESRPADNLRKLVEEWSFY